MDILAQALAIVERKLAYSTAIEQMEAAYQLRQLADELEASAGDLLDYEEFALDRRKNDAA